MSKVIHWVNAPLITSTMMGSMSYTVNNRVTHVDVAGSHINLSTKHLFTISKFAILHTLEKIKVFFYTAVSVWAFLAWLSKSATILADFLSIQIIYESQSTLNQLYSKVIQLAKIIRSIKHSVIPAKAQPLYICLNGINVLSIFLDRIGIIKTKIALAIILLCQTEIKANRLCVTYMKITVRLWRETCMNSLCIFSIL